MLCTPLDHCWTFQALTPHELEALAALYRVKSVSPVDMNEMSPGTHVAHQRRHFDPSRGRILGDNFAAHRVHPATALL